MNAANKLKLSNIFTALVSIVAIIQTMITNPPFTDDQVFTLGAVLTYAALVLTYAKQYFSPEVSDIARKATMWIAIIATVTGLLDLIKVFHLNDVTEQRIRWIITSVVAILNIISKQLFPSYFQQNKIEQLKTKQ